MARSPPRIDAKCEISSCQPPSHCQSAKALAECRVKVSRTELLLPYDTAVEYALAGNRSEAFKWLSNACDQHDDWLSYLKMDPAFDSLRSGPKFTVPVRRVGLPSCYFLSPLDPGALAYNASQARNDGCYYGQSAN